jgi:glycosyltransferase involved in cell wall biosynthesis
MIPRLTVVIPTRCAKNGGDWADGNVSVKTLRSQTFTNFAWLVVHDPSGKGASWARNAGFALVKTELVLFSDDDIAWEPWALESMVAALDAHPEAAYSYGAYRTNWRHGEEIYTVGDVEFDARLLRRRNYISTMSVIRSRDFPGFDESLKRYQDWDLWLTMLARGKVGVYCGKVTFETRTAPGGVTFGSVPTREARRTIEVKHGLQG